MEMGRRRHARVDQRVEALDAGLSASESKERVGGRNQPKGGSDCVPVHFD